MFNNDETNKRPLDGAGILGNYEEATVQTQCSEAPSVDSAIGPLMRRKYKLHIKDELKVLSSVKQTIALCVVFLLPAIFHGLSMYQVIGGDLLFKFFWVETDVHYTLSHTYAQDRQLNQAWVEETHGMQHPTLAPHFESMPLPGRVHLFQTRNLYIWSSIAEKHNISWSIISGTLLGYLRHGDFIPHDHDVDVLVDSRSIEFIRKYKGELLPPDIDVVKSFYWDGLKLLQHNETVFSKALFVDIFAYNVSNPNVHLFDGIYFPQSQVHPFRNQKRRMMGPSVVYIPENATRFLELDLCTSSWPHMDAIASRVRTGETCSLMRYSPTSSEERSGISFIIQNSKQGAKRPPRASSLLANETHSEAPSNDQTPSLRRQERGLRQVGRLYVEGSGDVATSAKSRIVPVL